MSDQPVVGRLLRGYGPLIGFLVVFTAMALLVPTVSDGPVNANGDFSSAGYDTDGDGIIDTAAGDDPAAVAGATATAGDANGDGIPDDQAGGATGGAGAAGGGTAGGGATGGGGNGSTNGSSGPAAAPVACEGRQVPADPYSPPCKKWTPGASNGGATSRGVTDKDIVITMRTQSFTTGLVDAIADQALPAAKKRAESPQKIMNTINGLIEFFNKYYQFYGRKLKLVPFQGAGNLLEEVTGHGTDGASNDALKASKEIGAFADIASITQPYAESLTRSGVINVGAPYMSRKWFTDRAPYAWSSLTDCSTVVETVSSWYLARMSGRPATYAGGALKNKPRKVALIYPDNYKGCVEDGVAIINKAGRSSEIGLKESYTLNIQTLSNQATAIVPKLKAAGITTVMCGCDPLIITFITQKASEQGMQLEWIEAGVALMDNDIVASLFRSDQWCRAAGPSFSGQTLSERQGIGYKAYKAVRSDEPSIAVELMYYNILVLAAGIQMAGPNLNPKTFEQGLFQYPLSTGPNGTWKFGPGDYTTSQDAREIAWSTKTKSVLTGEGGAYVDLNGGKRFAIGSWPAGDVRMANDCS